MQRDAAGRERDAALREQRKASMMQRRSRLSIPSYLDVELGMSSRE